MGCNFHAVAAEPHAAPVSRMVLRRIVKVENACRVLALLHERKIPVAEEICCPLSQGTQDPRVVARVDLKLKCETLPCPDQFKRASPVHE